MHVYICFDGTQHVSRIMTETLVFKATLFEHVLVTTRFNGNMIRSQLTHMIRILPSLFECNENAAAYFVCCAHLRFELSMLEIEDKADIVVGHTRQIRSVKNSCLRLNEKMKKKQYKALTALQSARTDEVHFLVLPGSQLLRLLSTLF